MILDLVGKKFGRLTVVAKATKSRYWVCKCDCGNENEVRANHLTMGKTVTCGECPIFELPGKKIGKLTVLEYFPDKSGRLAHRRFRCICDCGKETISQSTSLLSGRTQSCGQCIDKKSKVGKKFGHLRVMSWDGMSFSNSKWRCICDCGKEVSATIHRKHDHQSCGCARIRGVHWGERANGSKLIESQVIECRKLWAEEIVARKAYNIRKQKYSIQDLADKYSVSYACIYHIIYSRTWFFLPSVNSIIEDGINVE